MRVKLARLGIGVALVTLLATASQDGLPLARAQVGPGAPGESDVIACLQRVKRELTVCMERRSLLACVVRKHEAAIACIQNTR